MDEQEKFQGEVIFSRWYWVRNLQYRVKVETSETHWRRVHQPAHTPESGDEVVETYYRFLQIQEEIGSFNVHPAETFFLRLFDNAFFRLVNKMRRKEPFTNEGLLEHPNRLI